MGTRGPGPRCYGSQKNVLWVSKECNSEETIAKDDGRCSTRGYHPDVQCICTSSSGTMVSADSHTMVAKGMYYGYQQWYVSPYTMVLCMVCYGTVYVYDGWYTMVRYGWYTMVRICTRQWYTRTGVYQSCIPAGASMAMVCAMVCTHSLCKLLTFAGLHSTLVCASPRGRSRAPTPRPNCSHGGGAEEGVGGGGGVGDLLRARAAAVPQALPVPQLPPGWPVPSAPPRAVVQSPPPPPRQPCTPSASCTRIYHGIHRLQYEPREPTETPRFGPFSFAGQTKLQCSSIPLSHSSHNLHLTLTLKRLTLSIKSH